MTSPMLPRDSRWPFPCNPRFLTEEADEIRAYPFYVAAVADDFPYGDDADEEDPEEGPNFFATISDAAEYARLCCVHHGPVTIRERTHFDGYPDASIDPAVQYLAA